MRGVREAKKPGLKRYVCTRKQPMTLAKAKVIEDELQLSGASVHSQTPSLTNLPQVNPKESVQKYLDSQEEPFCLSLDITKGEDLHSEQKHHPENEPWTKVKQEPDAKQKIPFYSGLNPNSSPLRIHLIQFKQPWVPTLGLWPVESLYRTKSKNLTTAQRITTHGEGHSRI